ncbi:MAG: cytochrome c [Mucilaginibacter sp.]|nr:cytochrome c [Mucilaginibacter sp.]
MKSIGIKAVALTVVCFFLAGCSGNSGKTNTQPGTAPAALLPGRTLFENNCAACHGSNGGAGIAGAANLQISKADSTAIFKTISNGKNGMPPFKQSLSEKEIKQLTAYVSGLHK